MSPYKVTNPAHGQLEAENPSETDAEIRQAMSSANAAFAALNHIDVPGTVLHSPAALPEMIYLSPRKAADHRSRTSSTSRARSGSRSARHHTRHESGVGTPRRSARQADLLHAGGIGVALVMKTARYLGHNSANSLAAPRKGAMSVGIRATVPNRWPTLGEHGEAHSTADRTEDFPAAFRSAADS